MVDSRGIEAALRKLPGVVACSFAGDSVTVLLAEDADPAAIAHDASAIAAEFGASIRILEHPLGAGLDVRRAAPVRARIAIAAVAAVAIGIVATIVPLGKKEPTHSAAPPITHPAPAPAFDHVLPPVTVPVVVVPRPVKIPSKPSQSIKQVVSGAGSFTPSAPTIKPPQSSPPPKPVAEPSHCGSPGKAYGRRNHESAENASWHRHHPNSHPRYERWFDCP